MIRKIKKYCLVVAVVILLPLGITAIGQGGTASVSIRQDEIENILPEIVAVKADSITQKEALKALVIMERTRIKRQREAGKPLSEIMAETDKNSYYDKETEHYQEIVACVQETCAQVITYQQQLIDPQYHYLSAGQTRDMKAAYGSDDYPYLSSIKSAMDEKEEQFIQVKYLSQEEFQMICENLWQVKGEAYEITTTDSGEYVTTICIDGKPICGEAFREGFALASPAFTVKQVDRYVRIVTKGIGHGFGVSLYGANEMAKMGATSTTILTYYYPGTKIQSE